MTDAEKNPYVPKQFGRTIPQVVGSILLYVAALYAFTWAVPISDYIPFSNELMFFYLLVFGPLMGLSLLSGIASHGVGTLAWLFRDAPQRPAVDLFTILRGIPPTILSVISVFEISWVTGNFGGDDFFAQLHQFFTVYLVVAAIGIALEIGARVKRKRATTGASS